jgi:ubiquitin-protein ligase
VSPPAPPPASTASTFAFGGTTPPAGGLFTFGASSGAAPVPNSPAAEAAAAEAAAAEAAEAEAAAAEAAAAEAAAAAPPVSRIEANGDIRSGRLVKELQRAMHEDNNRWSPADKSTIYAVHPTDVDRWTVWLAGPAEGPYSSGVWELSVTFPPDYPYQPPSIFFVTPIYHPFVCQTSGKVAWLLDDDWSAAIPMRVVLYSLHSMLVDVKADASCWSENKLMRSMIQQLASDRADFDRVARKWTQAHAMGASHFQAWELMEAGYTAQEIKEAGTSLVRLFLRRCSPAIRPRARYLMWVARQLEALHGLPADALLDPWVECVMPLCVFVPDKKRQDKPDSLAPMSVEEKKVRDLGGRSRCPSIPKEEWVQRTWAQRLKMLEDALSETLCLNRRSNG